MYAFTAGFGIESESGPLDLQSNAGWTSGLRDDGFEVYRDKDYRAAARFLYPEQLLVEATLEGQAQYLSDWVVSAFRDLIGNPPPH